jgi:hypothetical protein
MQSFQQVSKDTRVKVRQLAWPNGAVLWCVKCPRRSEKTPDEMERYLKKWPRCCGIPAQVKPL